MTDLTERYVSATLRSIPEGQRADIEAELRASIDDAIEARLAGGAAHDEAERRVLLDLGDPDRLASGYSGRPGHLIGPELFFDYKRLLAVLLVTVVPIVAAVVFVVTLLAEDGIGAAFGSAIGTALTVALHIFFWVTLVFAILERSDGASSVAAWDLSKLPPIPSRRSVSLAETIATLVFLTLTITVLLISRSFSPFTAADGTPLPLFNPELWSFWMPFLIGVLILELVFELVKYRVGHWTWTLAWMNLGLNLLFSAPAVYLLMSEQLFNPEFFDSLGLDLGTSSDSPLVLITVAVIVGIAAWDSIDGFRKAARG
jgi:hypothetical protein